MDAAAKMELFGNLMYISIAIAVVGFGLAVFFFFFFDIRSIRALMTGKARQQTIQRMAEQHSKTGTLRHITENTRDPSLPRIQHPAMPPTAEIKMPENKPYDFEAEETGVLSGAEETGVLGGREVNTSTEVTGRQSDAGETSILTQPAPQPDPVIPGFRFEVTESTMLIHTQEFI
ncbi:MAG: hypothetical protein IJO45_03120 [Oscillospiraceae bacterium]|nr:hypothetical protein [Oscillospiraceae bacterium]